MPELTPTCGILRYMKTYAEKAVDIEQEIASLNDALINGCIPEPSRQAQTEARIASLQRSLSWYLPRIPRPTPIESLGVGVGDDIQSTEAGPG